MPGKSRARQAAELATAAIIAQAEGQRPSRYVPAFARLAKDYAMLGADNATIAEMLNVPASTFDTWLVAHAPLRRALSAGREMADARVAKALHASAVGFKARETKVFNVGGRLKTVDVTKTYPPNVAAGLAWLTNKRRGMWRDTKHVEHTGQVDLAAIIQRSHEIDMPAIEGEATVEAPPPLPADLEE